MSRITPYLLWAALVATLVGTLTNTTWAFATVNGGNLLWGAVQAVAADLGLVALAATLAERRARGERAGWLWVAVAGFVGVSTYASYLHSYAQATALDAPGAALRPLLLGAFLPLMLFALVEVVSHARRASAPATESELSDAQRIERAQSNAQLDALTETAERTAAQLAALETQSARWQAESVAHLTDLRASVPLDAPQPATPTNGHKEPCEHCGALIGASQQARAAHKRYCVAQQGGA